MAAKTSKANRDGHPKGDGGNLRTPRKRQLELRRYPYLYLSRFKAIEDEFSSALQLGVNEGIAMFDDEMKALEE